MSGKEELIERNRNRSHFEENESTNETDDGKIISSIRLISILPIRGQFARRVKQKKKKFSSLYRRLSWDGK